MGEEKIELREEFYKLIVGFLETHKGGKAILAHKFGVSLPTVERWASGKNAPYHLLLPKIIMDLKEMR